MIDRYRITLTLTPEPHEQSLIIDLTDRHAALVVTEALRLYCSLHKLPNPILEKQTFLLEPESTPDAQSE